MKTNIISFISIGILIAIAIALIAISISINGIESVIGIAGGSILIIPLIAIKRIAGSGVS